MRLKQRISEPFGIVSDIGFYTVSPSDAIKKEICFKQFNGKSVALHCHPANLVKYVIELDSVAKSVLLVPYDACGVFSRRVRETLDLDAVLTDGIANTEHWELPIIRLDELMGGNAHEGNKYEYETQWLLATSGTTGTPKIVAHTIDSLTRTTAKSKNNPSLNWGLLYDPARFAGFQVVLQAIMGSTKLIIPSPELNFESKINYLVRNGCNALSATPSLWRKILMARAAKDIILKQITLGGEIADQRVLNSLNKQFPDASITHIFASTEAGVGFSVKDKKAGFPLSWLESGVRDVEVKISSHGTLLLKNTHRAQHYVGESSEIANDEGWIDTGDLVEINEGRVFFKGRLNGAINVGGNKVIPEDVESEILKVPGVFHVVVRAKASSIAGSLVEALVVADPELDDKGSLMKSIKQHCKQMLPSFKVPAFVRLVDELPVGSTGKIKR